MMVRSLLIVAAAATLLSPAAPTAAELEFADHLVANNLNSWSTMAGDIDGDGDIDIVGSARFGNRVAWWENDGQQGFSLHNISSAATLAMAIYVIDLDSDGDLDVVATHQGGDELAWYDNDGQGGFTERPVAPLVSPSYLYATDIDGDGDVDIVAVACEDGSNRVVWYENDGEQHFIAHIVKEGWDHANSVHAADLDSDGDVDILGTASKRGVGWGEISWFENDGNEVFTEHIISEGWGRPSNVSAADLDRDGDLDVLATACLAHQVVWFENDGSEGFTRRTIGSQFVRPRCVRTGDLDGDGDIDVIAAAIDSDQIAWWENDGHQGFAKHVVTDQFDGATHVHVTDIDGDGDLDILGAAQFGGQIAWWENLRRAPEPRQPGGRVGFGK
jgi:hypothetical protein